MAFLITAILGLFFVIAYVRWQRIIFRFLLGALGVTVGSFLWLALGRHNLYVAWAPIILVPAAGFAWWKAREARSEKRRVRKAFQDEIGDDNKPAVPKVEEVERISEGVVLYRMTLPANQNFRGLSPVERAKIEARWEWLLDCRKVTIHSDTLRGRQGTVTVDYLPEPPEPDYPADLGPWPGWPGADDFSQPIPVGETKTGRPVTLQLVTSTGCRNILIFGQPGSGKSVGASEIIATAAQDPSVELWGMDGGGGTDLEFWRDRMTEYEVLPERAFLMLRKLDAEIRRRSEEMRIARRRKIDPHDPKIVVIGEEFPTFTDDKTKRSFETGLPSTGKDDPGEKLVDLKARCQRLGRKYGVSFVDIAQVPTVDAVPGKIRRLYQYRWGFRTLEAVAWRAGMGTGIPFVRLDADKAGDSVLVTENGMGTRMRSYFISDEELEEIAAATSLAPVDSLAPDTDTISADLCLETGENGAAPSEIVAAPSAAPAAAPYLPDAWDLAALSAAIDGRIGPEAIRVANLVEKPGLSAGAARKRLKILTGAGYLSAPPRLKVTDPQLYVTTITGREALKREDAQ